jgi:hypothetical protein
MHALHRSSRLPRSGNSALAAGALVQAVVGLEFVFAGLAKAINPAYRDAFRGIVQNSPGASSGPLMGVMQTLVLPHPELAAQMAMLTELVAGAILVVTALEVARRRFGGRLGAPHAYEPMVALLSAAAAFALGGLSLVIYLMLGGRLPTIDPAFAFGAPIALELLLVPLALGIAWLELGRYFALRATLR